MVDEAFEWRLRGVRVHVQGRDDFAGAIAQRRRRRADAAGELLVRERPTARSDLAKLGSALGRVGLPERGETGATRFAEHGFDLGVGEGGEQYLAEGGLQCG